MSSPARDIEAVLEESGPEYGAFDYEVPGGGHQSDVFLVTLEHDDEEYEVVVKFEPPEVDSFAVEPRLHDYVAKRTAVPVPEILVFEDDPETDVPPYFVTVRLEGENLAEAFADISTDVRERVMHQVGHMLADLHDEIAFEGFGWLDLWNDRITVRDVTASWREYFGQLTRTHLDGLAGTPFEDLRERAEEHLEPALERLPEDGVPRLVHDDFRPANLLFDPTREAPITAVLDWQDSLAALPEYQLAATEFLFVDSSIEDPETRETLRESLYDGYRSRREYDFGGEYAERRPIYQLSTLLWRMGGFDGAFADASGLVRARAEARYRQEFDRLLEELPEA